MMLLYFFGLVATISSAAAQTWTSCNPLNETCPPDQALGTNYTWNFSTDSLMDNSIWNITNGAVDYTEEAAQFTIQQKLDSPTVRSTFYLFFGIVESHVQAASGQGVVSSVVLQSDDLDEIDWEWIGSEGTAQSNYYGKGNATYNRGVHHNVTGGATNAFHNYTTHWTAEKLEWWIDGMLVRTVQYADAVGGLNYPQTPMTVRLGIWPGGDPSEPQGTVEWAGGAINYDAGPYNMYVSSVHVQDFHTGQQYIYTDRTGSWQSINVTACVPSE
jgi:Glycosyl hydrolases family 16